MTETTLRQQIQLDAGVLSNPYWQGSRITTLLNHAQNWLQLKLIKQGYKNWKGEDSLSFGDSTVQYIETSTATTPTDWLKETPIVSVMPVNSATKPAKEIGIEDLVFVSNNAVLAPSQEYPVFVMLNEAIHLYPRTVDAGGKCLYTKKITDLIYDDTTESEIPDELQHILVERVIMQIKSAIGEEQIKQAKKAEIDKELTDRYQLDQVIKVDNKDKGVTQ